MPFNTGSVPLKGEPLKTTPPAQQSSDGHTNNARPSEESLKPEVAQSAPKENQKKSIQPGSPPDVKNPDSVLTKEEIWGASRRTTTGSADKPASPTPSTNPSPTSASISGGIPETASGQTTMPISGAQNAKASVSAGLSNTSSYTKDQLAKAYRDFDQRKYQLAYPVLKAASDAGVQKAQYSLAIMYLYGHVVSLDIEKARALFLSSLPSLTRDEIYSIGAALDGARNTKDGVSYDRKMEMAIYFYDVAAKKESGSAQYALARLATNRDDDQARISWLEKAVANKHPHATYQLGKSYYDGRGGSKDTERGLALIRTAKVLGDDYATYWLERNPN